jgi:hypothetical protein
MDVFVNFENEVDNISYLWATSIALNWFLFIFFGVLAAFLRIRHYYRFKNGWAIFAWFFVLA